MTGKKKAAPTTSAQAKGPSLKVSPPTPKPVPAMAVPGGDNQVWQQAHDALQAAFEQGNAILDQTKGAQLKTLNSLLDTLSDELTALDQEEMQDHTISLQAATQQLGDGMAKLQTLRDQIAHIADTIADAAKVVTAIDDALSGITSFLATFPAI